MAEVPGAHSPGRHNAETAFVGSPYLAVMFEQQFHRAPDGAADTAWLAFFSAHDRPPADPAEAQQYLKQFIGIDVTEYTPPDPTVATTGNGTESPEPSPS